MTSIVFEDKSQLAQWNLKHVLANPDEHPVVLAETFEYDLVYRILRFFSPKEDSTIFWADANIAIKKAELIDKLTPHFSKHMIEKWLSTDSTKKAPPSRRDAIKMVFCFQLDSTTGSRFLVDVIPTVPFNKNRYDEFIYAYALDHSLSYEKAQGMIHAYQKASLDVEMAPESTQFMESLYAKLNLLPPEAFLPQLIDNAAYFKGYSKTIENQYLSLLRNIGRSSWTSDSLDRDAKKERQLYNKVNELCGDDNIDGYMAVLKEEFGPHTSATNEELLQRGIDDHIQSAYEHIESRIRRNYQAISRAQVKSDKEIIADSRLKNSTINVAHVYDNYLYPSIVIKQPGNKGGNRTLAFSKDFPAEFKLLYKQMNSKALTVSLSAKILSFFRSLEAQLSVSQSVDTLRSSLERRLKSSYEMRAALTNEDDASFSTQEIETTKSSSDPQKTLLIHEQNCLRKLIYQNNIDPTAEVRGFIKQLEKNAFEIDRNDILILVFVLVSKRNWLAYSQETALEDFKSTARAYLRRSGMADLSYRYRLDQVLLGCFGPDSLCSYASLCRAMDHMAPVATLVLKSGDEIGIELYPDKAPNTVNNFIALANSGFYDGQLFHRIVRNSSIHGGDPNNGTGAPGYTIVGEFADNNFTKNDIAMKAGVIAMARVSMQTYDSAGSQFFILVADKGNLQGQYAAFGKVVSGLNILQELSVNNEGKSRNNITIESLRVETYGVNYDCPVTLANSSGA